MIGDIIWEIQFQACTIISIGHGLRYESEYVWSSFYICVQIDKGLHVPSKRFFVFSMGRPCDFRLCYPPDSRYPAKLCKRGSTMAGKSPLKSSRIFRRISLPATFDYRRVFLLSTAKCRSKYLVLKKYSHQCRQ